jgi:HEAT repeat protein
MPKSIAEIRRQLGDAEPDEKTYRGLGSDDVAAVATLLDDDEAWLAARAVFALSRIDSDDARRRVVAAADNPRAEVRVAVATVASGLPPASSDAVLAKLLQDTSVGVRKFALRSVSPRNSVEVKRAVAALAASETNPKLRQIAGEKAAPS